MNENVNNNRKNNNENTFISIENNTKNKDIIVSKNYKNNNENVEILLNEIEKIEDSSNNKINNSNITATENKNNDTFFYSNTNTTSNTSTNTNTINDEIENNLYNNSIKSRILNDVFLQKILQKIENENDYINNNIIYPKKLGYLDVEKVIRCAYYTKQDYYSSAFDLIAGYLKSQKSLNLEARYISMKRLSCLIMPAIFLSAVASVLSLTIDKYHWGGIIVASVNAFNGFLLSIINYLKLDAKAEAFRISSHQYDKLQSMCEFTSGCLMVLPSNNDEDLIAKEKLELIEQKIKEIKETNGFVIPLRVRKSLPTIYNTNIFSLVKNIYNKEISIINEIKDILNNLRLKEYYKKLNMYKYNKLQELVYENYNDKNIYKIENLIVEIENNILELDKKIKELRSCISNKIINLFDLKSEYTKFDKIFENEIKNSEKNRRWYIC